MAAQSPDSAGWRGSPGGNPAGGRDGGAQHWRKSSPLSGAKRGFLGSKWLKVGLLLAGVTACALAIVAIFVWSPATGVRILVASAPEYQFETVPINPQSTTDSQTVSQLDVLKHRLQPVNIAPLESLTDPPPSSGGVKEVMVIVVSLLAGRDGQGNYLLLQNSDPDQKDKLLREEALWTWLEKLDPRQPKLLLLDFARVTSDWRTGRFHPAIWEGLAQKAEKIRGLVVMTSCAPGEQSWTSSLLGKSGTSAFLHYVIKGLAGEADGNGDKSIQVSELNSYVATNTAHWVVNNRDESGQHPQLIPAPENLQAKDFVICKVFNQNSSPFPAAVTLDPKVNSIEQQLIKLWQDRDQMRLKPGSSPPWKDLPVQWMIFHHELLAAEHALDAGHLERSEGILQRASTLLAAIQKGAPVSGQPYSAFPYLRDNIVSRWIAGSPAQSGPSFLKPEEVLKRHLEGGGAWPVKRDLPTGLVNQAVTLQSVAEQAASPDPVATRWIEKSLADTEQSLRSLEDELFTGKPPTSNDPRFAELTGKLKSLQTLAGEVADAEETLLEIRAELPALLRWAAERKGNTPLRARLMQVCLETPDAFSMNRPLSVMQTWEREADAAQGVDSVECLVAALAGWTGRIQYLTSEAGRQELTGQQGLEAAGKQLKQATEKARELSRKISARLEVEAGELSRLSPESPQPLHRRRIVDVLKYPGLKAETRRELRQKLQRFEQAMQERTSGVSKGSSPELSSVEARQKADIFDSRWQTFWILQLPGGLENFQQTELVETWNRIAATDDPNAAMNIVGDLGLKIAERWRARSQYIEEQLKANVKFEEKRVRYQAAERSAVWLDYRDARPLVDALGEPVRYLRSFDSIELAMLHARRQLESYWIDKGDAPGTTPWYLDATGQCLAYVDQAGRSYGMSVSDMTASLRTQMRERQDAGLQVRLSQQEQIRFGVSGNRLPVQATAASQGNLPQGTTSVWINLSDTGRVRVLENGIPLASKAGADVTFQLDRVSAENCDELKGEALAFFRGHIWRANDLLEVKPCRDPGRITKYIPAPTTGSVVVNGKDQRPTVLILDCSLSMSFSILDDQKFVGPESPESKFQIALSRLESILQTEFAPEDQVGLILYGHRAKLEGGKVVFNQDWFRDLTGLPDPQPDPALVNLGRDGWQDQEIRVPVGPFSRTRNQIEQELARIRRTKPYGITPLMHAISKGLGSEMLSEAGGIVLAITDGEASDEEYDITGAINRIPCGVFIVGFGVKPDVLAKLQKMANKFQNVTVLDAPNGETLRNQLGAALKDRQYSISRVGGTPLTVDPTDLGKSVLGLPPGEYEVSFPDFQPTRFRVTGGEHYEFNLIYESGQSREILINQVRSRQRKSIADPDLASPDYPTFIDYRTYIIDESGTPSLEIVLGRENPSGSSRPIRPVRRPEQVDFEVTPVGGEWNGNLEWMLLPDTTVPTWKLSLKDFPIDKPVQVKGWWRPTRLPPGALVQWAKLAPTTSERPVEVPLPDPDGLLHAYAVRPRPGLLQLVFTFPVSQAVSRQMIEELGKLDVQLGQVDPDGKFTPYDLSIRKDFGADDGSLIVEFDLTGVDLDRSTVGVTSSRAIRQGALTAPVLQINQQDRTGTNR